ncbi:hypothetical protein Elgi_66700 [Paenibacillus elgii]|nr:hypothetical protein Elgi_66700 [Paenibacillus elgii]
MYGSWPPLFPFTTKYVEVPVTDEEEPTHTVRHVLRTTNETRSNDYVD